MARRNEAPRGRAQCRRQNIRAWAWSTIGWSEATIRPFVLGVIEHFGVDRVMFASNFPVDKLYSSFDALFGAFENIVASFSEGEKDKLFHDNALRTYRL